MNCAAACSYQCRVACTSLRTRSAANLWAGIACHKAGPSDEPLSGLILRSFPWDSQTEYIFLEKWVTMNIHGFPKSEVHSCASLSLYCMSPHAQFLTVIKVHFSRSVTNRTSEDWIQVDGRWAFLLSWHSCRYSRVMAYSRSSPRQPNSSPDWLEWWTGMQLILHNMIGGRGHASEQ